MKKNGKRFRDKSLRLPDWDYGSNASYFITLCTKDRIHYFGSVGDKKMVLSQAGETAQRCWEEIPVHFPFVQTGSFIIMPDHLHGIITINKTEEKQSVSGSKGSLSSADPSKNKFGPQSRNLASIIRGFKAGVSKEIRRTNPGFSWQRNYYERIIRDEEAFRNISIYIEKNPEKW